MTAHTPALIKDVAFSDLRIPYRSEVEVFGIDNVGWKVLIDTVFPSARSLDAIIMALTYCRRRNLDVFKRVVHVVPMWSTAKNAYVETVWPGIAELRTTASRTGQYAGCDEAEFGPDVTRVFKAIHGKETREVKVVFPEWCRITTYRLLHGQRCAFVGPKVYWLESYGRWRGTEVPNDMWAKRPVGQIEKCAEAGSVRRAFPEEIGNELVAEEMEGQRMEGAAEHRPLPPPPPEEDEPAPMTIEHEPQEERPEPPPPEDEEHHPPRDDAREKLIADAMQQGYDARKTFPDLTADAVPPQLRNDREAADAWRQGFHAAGHVEEEPDVVAEFKARASKMEMEEELAVLWQDVVKPQYRELDRETQRALMDAYRERETALKQNRLAQKYK